ncbi:hypothetical protein IJ670_07640 [bacterium]|nr:hypothetical protein [bacterium]
MEHKMEIQNNINSSHIQFNSNQNSSQFNLKDFVKSFRNEVMALDECNQQEGVRIQKFFNNPNSQGDYFLSLTQYKTKEGKMENNLKISLNTKHDSTLSMSLVFGTKQDVLDYLGNEKNLDEIELFTRALLEEAKY